MSFHVSRYKAKAAELGEDIFYKVYYKRYLRQTIKEPIRDVPAAVSKAAVKKVWSRYCAVDPRWMQYYTMMNGIASPYYIPSDVWFARICRTLNRRTLFRYPMLQDKNYLDMLFADTVRCPEILARNINGQFLGADFKPIPEEAALEAACAGRDEVVLKPSVASSHGRNVTFVSRTADEAGFRADVAAAMKKLSSDYNIQGVLKQHPALAALNPDSINTFRVLSLLWKGEVHILGALIRIGVKGVRVDNPASSNGVSCVLTEAGTLSKFAYDRDWYPHTQLPNGMTCEGYAIPGYEAVLETVRRLHYKVPHSRVIGWDLTVLADETPVLIEANLKFPEIYFHQLGAGPLIRDRRLFDEVLRCAVKG